MALLLGVATGSYVALQLVQFESARVFFDILQDPVSIPVSLAGIIGTYYLSPSWGDDDDSDF